MNCFGISPPFSFQAVSSDRLAIFRIRYFTAISVPSLVLNSLDWYTTTILLPSLVFGPLGYLSDSLFHCHCHCHFHASLVLNSLAFLEQLVFQYHFLSKSCLGPLSYLSAPVFLCHFLSKRCLSDSLAIICIKSFKPFWFPSLVFGLPGSTFGFGNSIQFPSKRCLQTAWSFFRISFFRIWYIIVISFHGLVFGQLGLSFVAGLQALFPIACPFFRVFAQRFTH
jgi:hypothetical protein